MTPSNLEILAYETTPLGDLCLRRRELLSRPGTVITEITLDHQLLMSSYNTVSERALANEALARHPGRDLSVLVCGLGLGYTASAVLQSQRVQRVEVVEIFAAVIGFLREGLVPLSEELLADPRFTVTERDAYAVLNGPAGPATSRSTRSPGSRAPSTIWSPAGSWLSGRMRRAPRSPHRCAPYSQPSKSCR